MSKKKHVVFAQFQIVYGGGERVLIEQVAALAELPIKVSVLFEHEPGQRDIEPELRRRNPNIEEIIWCSRTWDCAKWILSRRFDAAVVCYHRRFLKALRRLARCGFRRPMMVTLHEKKDVHIEMYQESKHLVSSWLLCYDFENHVREHLRFGDTRIIHPLYPSHGPVAWGAAERLSARRQLGLPEEGFFVGNVGRQAINKEPWTTLAIAERLQPHLRRPIHVLFAGHESANVTPTLDAAIAKSPLKGRIWRFPKMTDNKPAFHALDLFVLPSWSEGFFPLAMIEAMERGVPALTTTVGGIATVLRDGEGGFLIPKVDDGKPLSKESIEQAPLALLPYIQDPKRWEAQRRAASDFIHRLRDNYDARDLYRKTIMEMLESGHPSRPKQ